MSSKSRNPRWTRDEIILALDLYVREGRKQLSNAHPEIQELSQLFRKLPIHEEHRHKENFRNSTGISMKLGNFLYLDPQYEGRGLTAASKLDEEVWNEFAEETDRLNKIANAIRRNLEATPETLNALTTDSDEEEFSEGRLLSRLHKYRERDSTVSRKKKRQVLMKTGKLECEVCDFDFAEAYGEVGEGFAECHHTKPLSELEPGEKTKLRDLAILCANCHRMLHRTKEVMELSELRSMLRPPAWKRPKPIK